MANSVIAALRVNLGLDSAQFDSGLKKSSSGMANFGKAAAAGAAAVAAAAAAAAVALGAALKGATDFADGMSKAAQRAGVTTEALSRLNYAAGLSDVSLEKLTAGLGRLGNTMALVAQGAGGPAKAAFTALGISVTDASGKLRASDEVFADVAEQFSKMENGSAKTALAIQIFGRAGAEMIPMLNAGRDGLAAMAAESDRFGQTISTRAGVAAESFNDSLTRLSIMFSGIANRVANEVLPMMAGLAESLVTVVADSGVLDIAVKGLVWTFGALVKSGLVVQTTFQSIGDVIWGVGRAIQLGFAGQWDAARQSLDLTFNAIGIRLKDLQTNLAAVDMGTFLAEAAAQAGGLQSALDNLDFASMGASAEAAQTQLQTALEAMRMSLMTEEQAEIASHEKRLAQIAEFYSKGAILKAEHDSMMEGAQAQHAERMNAIAQKQIEEEAKIRSQLVGHASSVFGSLSTIMENFGSENLAASKAFAVAAAIINTAEGITKALAQGGVLGFAGAASVAAAGAAQISTILSASKGGSKRPTVGASGAGAAAPSAPVQRQIGGTIIVHGSQNDFNMVEGVVKGITEMVNADGANDLVLAIQRAQR